MRLKSVWSCRLGGSGLLGCLAHERCLLCMCWIFERSGPSRTEQLAVRQVLCVQSELLRSQAWCWLSVETQGWAGLGWGSHKERLAQPRPPDSGVLASLPSILQPGPPCWSGPDLPASTAPSNPRVLLCSLV